MVKTVKKEWKVSDDQGKKVNDGVKKAIFTVVMLVFFAQAMVFAQNARWAEVRVYYTPFRGIESSENVYVQAIDQGNAEGLAITKFQEQYTLFSPPVTRVIFVRWLTPAESDQLQRQEQARNYNARGNSFYRQSNWNSAIAEYTEAIRLNPNNAVYYNNRAGAYNGKGDYDRAIADATEAIRLDANNATYYVYRGNAYYEKNDWDRAIADYTQAIRLDSNNATYYGNRGNAYSWKSDWDRAIADFTQANRIAPDSVLGENWTYMKVRAEELMAHYRRHFKSAAKHWCSKAP